MMHALVSADFCHAAFRSEIAFQITSPPVFLSGSIERRDDGWPGVSLRVGFLGDGPAGDRDGASHRASPPPSRRFAITDAASFVDVGGNDIARKVSDRQEGRALADCLEVLDFQSDFSLARDGEQMQHGVGRAPGGGDAGNRVFKRAE